MINLGSITIASGTKTTFTTPSDGMQGIIIGNLSGLTCTISMVGSGTTKTLYPSTTDFFPVKKGFTGVISIVPVSTLSNVSSFSANTLIFDAVGINEAINVNAYPMILPVQAINPTASGKDLFGVTYFIGSTVSNDTVLNIFNPLNSGVNFKFYSVRTSTNNTGFPSSNLVYVKGVNNNLAGGSLTPLNHSVGGAASKALVTYSDNNAAGLSYTNTLEIATLASDIVFDFLIFPDEIIMPPGYNLFVDISAGAATKQNTHTFKWSEPIIGT